MHVEVLVLGAGAAGLAAAREAADAGRSVLVLEARDRPGGRIRTLTVPGLGAVELGAEFVHGDAPETLALARRQKARRARVRGRHWEQGPDGPIRAKPRWDRLAHVLRQLDPGPDDRAVAAALAEVDAPEEDRRFALAFLTGFDALDPEQASLRAVLSQEGDDPGAAALDSRRIPAGQATLLAPLAEGLSVRTRAVVRRVRHAADGVTVEADDGLGGTLHVTARRAVIALPLGVLQAGDVPFDPPLPWSLDAVASGAVVRIVLAFDRPFWEERLPRLGFLHGRGTFPTFWAERGRPTITAWCGGPPARRLSGRPEAERVATALDDLAPALGVDRAELGRRLLGWYTHDWQNDPFARGAYSYVTVGGLDRVRRLAEPRGALALAGEYVPGDGVTATVEAALVSGRRAGRWAAGVADR